MYYFYMSIRSFFKDISLASYDLFINSHCGYLYTYSYILFSDTCVCDRQRLLSSTLAHYHSQGVDFDSSVIQ